MEATTNGEDGNSSSGRDIAPIPLGSAYTQCLDGARLVSPCTKIPFVRHASLVWCFDCGAYDEDNVEVMFTNGEKDEFKFLRFAFKASVGYETYRIESSGGCLWWIPQCATKCCSGTGDCHMEGYEWWAHFRAFECEPLLMNFFIIGYDDLWDVFRNHNTVDFAGRRFREHGDHLRCCKELIMEAFKRNSGNNLAVVVIFFHR